MTGTDQLKGDWTPLHAVFEHNNQLWVLEGLNKNGIRVVRAGSGSSTIIPVKKTNQNFVFYILVGCLVIGMLLLYLWRKTK